MKARGRPRARVLPGIAAALASAFGAACATAQASSRPGLEERVAAVVQAAPLDQVHWGVLAVDASSGDVLVGRQAERKFIPASNMKLLGTAAALHLLGPGHTFETALHAAGTFDAETGVLVGDLVLPGTGDPTLSERFWEEDVAPLRALADSLRRAGVREVTGGLVVDASAWDSSSVVGSWMVGDLPAAYAATGGAFAVAEGETTIVLRGGTVAGELARVEWWPLGEEGFVVSRVVTLPAGDTTGRVEAAYLPESRRLVLQGTMEAGTVDTVRVATRDPVRQATAALERALREAGVSIRGGWRVAWEPGEPLGGGCSSGALASCGAARLAGLRSPPLTEVVEAVLEPSQNWITEQLVRALGPHRRPDEGRPGDERPARGGWRDGLTVVRRFMVEEVGVDSLDLLLRDGSGLSTQNLLTPRAIVRLLDYALRTPWGDAFRVALAEPGEEDSTLERRFEGLGGRVFAKTGSLTNVASLSGYLIRPDGRTILFSIMTNASGLPASRVRQGIDRIVELLAAGG